MHSASVLMEASCGDPGKFSKVVLTASSYFAKLILNLSRRSVKRNQDLSPRSAIAIVERRVLML